MIDYRYPEEKSISIFYAKKLGATTIPSIIETGEVKNSNEASELAKFYWQIVVEVINEKNSKIDHGFGNMEEWMEYYAIHSFLLIP